jgi:hypothetical protein
MNTRTNPNKRKLEVEWNTERWTPQIQVRPGNRPQAGLHALYDPFSFVPEKPRKRKQPPVSVVWVRSGTRSSWR